MCIKGFCIRQKGLIKAIFAVTIWFGVLYSGGVLADTTGGTVIGKNIFDVATNLLGDVQNKIIGLSSAAASIAVGTGVFMKKFSMGKQDKVELGNKVIRDSLIGWFILNAMTFILKYLSQFLGTGTPT